MTDGPRDERVEWPDVLRGVSAMAIVLFHVRVTMWVGLRALSAGAEYSWIDRAMAWVTLPFPFFGSAVMLFFIVSGFAIHYPFARPNGAAFAIKPYAVRRFLRIYPPYLAAVGFSVLAERVAAMLIHQTPSEWAKIGATVAMAQNYVPPAGQMAGNPSLWSLPVEVELYLVYPLLLWFWRRAGTSAMLTCVGIVSAAATGVLLSGHEWPMSNFAKYWIIWASGAVLAEWMRTRRLPAWRTAYGWLAAAALILIVTGRALNVPMGVEHFIWGAIYFLLMLWALNRPEALAQMPLRARVAARFLGDISYSLYLVHFPLLLAIGAGWVAIFGSKPVSVLVPLIASLTPIPVAYALWRCVERPSHAYARAWARRSVQTSAPSSLHG